MGKDPDEPSALRLEIRDLQNHATALRGELEAARSAMATAVQRAVAEGGAEDRAEIAQLQGAIGELRQRLEDETNARQRDRREA